MSRKVLTWRKPRVRGHDEWTFILQMTQPSLTVTSSRPLALTPVILWIDL